MTASIVVAVVLLCGCQIAGGILAGILVSRQIRRTKTEVRTEISQILVEWTTPAGEGKPSKAAELVDMIGAVIGSAAARSIMAQFNADASHAARAANTAADNIEAARNPLLSILTGTKRGKGAAVARLAEMLGGMFTGSGAGQQMHLPLGSNGGSERSVSDRIKHQGGM